MNLETHELEFIMNLLERATEEDVRQAPFFIRNEFDVETEIPTASLYLWGVSQKVRAEVEHRNAQGN